MKIIDRIAKCYETSFTQNYKYPGCLIGRTQENLKFPSRCDILVFAAHPDDESLGIGTVLYRHQKQGDTISVVFTTNGRGGTGWTTRKKHSEATANLRYNEACDALAVIGVHHARIHCLGFPDGGLYRYIGECMNDVGNLVRCIQPKRIYVHCWDGGHVDHDTTNLIVRATCKQMRFFEVYEWAEYNVFTTNKDRSFVLPDEAHISPIIPSDDERKVKQTMIDKYPSQHHILERYQCKNEVIRKACLNSMKIVPTLYPKELQNRVLNATRPLQLVLAN